MCIRDSPSVVQGLSFVACFKKNIIIQLQPFVEVVPTKSTDVNQSTKMISNLTANLSMQFQSKVLRGLVEPHGTYGSTHFIPMLNYYNKE